VRIWHCPNCDAAARTITSKVPWHHCGGLKGLTAPLIPDGEKARVAAVDREDYVGKEHVQTDGDGRPVMALDVERADGSSDRVVYAPAAYATAGEIEEAASIG
jgi:hypothetical protein